MEYPCIRFLGTATLVIRYREFTVLTDPNFIPRGERIHIGYTMHSTRLLDPALSIDELPPIDLAVVSHIHEDHFDRVARQRLDRELPIVTTHQGAGILRRQGFSQLHALYPWKSAMFWKDDTSLRVTAVPASHAPGPLSALFPSVMGSILEFRHGGGPVSRIYLSGDTLLKRGLREIPGRFPEIDIAVLHLGGARIGGLLVTMDAAQGVELAHLLRPRLIIPVHYGDYPEMAEPVGVFVRRAEFRGMGPRLRVLERGETFEYSPPSLASREAV